MSKSSIKTKTVLTMTDMTESTELLAFKRQMDGYKVTVKISLCICVVPHVTNVLDLRYKHNPLFYHLNLIPCRY